MAHASPPNHLELPDILVDYLKEKELWCPELVEALELRKKLEMGFSYKEFYDDLPVSDWMVCLLPAKWTEPVTPADEFIEACSEWISRYASI